MSSMSGLFTIVGSHNSLRDVYRARQETLAAEAHERALRRQQQLDEQCSSLNTPQERIRIWEQVHGLRLPLNPAHAVLRVVALGTGLSLEQVQAEQRARRAGP